MDRRIKRLLRLVGFLILFSTYMVSTFSYAKQTKLIKVGYFDYSGFIEKDADGSFTGYGVEYLKELSKYTSWEYEYVYGSWSECLERLKNGEIDLLCTAQYTKERDELYDYCEYSSGLEYAVLYASQQNDEIYYKDYEALNGKKVGMMENSFQNEQFHEFQKKHGLELQPIYFKTTFEMEEALKSGLVDVIVSGSLLASPEIKLIDKIGVKPFYFITDEGNTVLMKQLNAGMKELLLEIPDFNTVLYEKYYGSPVGILQGRTKAEAEFIEENKTLRVSYAKNCYPMEYQDSKTKQARGIFPDLVRKIAEYAGFELEFVVASSPSEALRMVGLGEVDLSTVFYGNVSGGKAYGICYSNIYTVDEIAVIARRDSNVEEREELTIAVPNGYTNYVMYLQENYPNWEIENYRDIDHCMEAVDLGKADITLVDALYLQTASNTSFRKSLVVVSGMEVEMPVSLAMQQNSEKELCTILNKAVLMINEQDLKEIRINNTTVNTSNFQLLKWLRQHLGLISVFIGFWAVITFIALQRKELYYRRLAMIDELTGVWNRTHFLKEAEEILNYNKNQEYYMISTDIDKFKYINDTFGYNMGDEVLKEEARQFAEIFGTRGIFARIIADEFVGLIECSESENEKDLMENLKTFESNMRNYAKHYFRIQIKIGIYKIEKRENNIRITECIDRANIAKKHIKGNLNQMISYFDEETAKRSALENEIEGKMEKALENGEFCVYYQPKYNLRTEKIEGAEALVRWIEPDKGMIGPNLFIPLFEKNGFIIRLDFYVYETVCKHLKQWIKEGKPLVPISLNVSRAHLGTPNFIPDLVALLKKYEIPVELIELELKESVFSENEEVVEKMVVLLKNIGFRITIDDFGSGYSSLNLLKQIPVDVLKIDKGLLDEIENSKKSKIIIEQVVNMAKKLNIYTVCEGVETQQEEEFLKEIQCNAAQGDLYSTPISVDEFETKISGQEF